MTNEVRDGQKMRLGPLRARSARPAAACFGVVGGLLPGCCASGWCPFHRCARGLIWGCGWGAGRVLDGPCLIEPLHPGLLGLCSGATRSGAAVHKPTANGHSGTSQHRPATSDAKSDQKNKETTAEAVGMWAKRSFVQAAAGRVMSTAPLLSRRLQLQQPLHRNLIVHRHHAIPSRSARLCMNRQLQLLVHQLQATHRVRRQADRRWKRLKHVSVGRPEAQFALFNLFQLESAFVNRLVVCTAE